MSPRETSGEGERPSRRATADSNGPGEPGVWSSADLHRHASELSVDESADGRVSWRAEQPQKEGRRKVVRCGNRRPQEVVPIDRVIAESVDESLKETSAWILELVVVAVLYRVNPVLGHVVTIAFKIKEMAGDVEGRSAKTVSCTCPFSHSVLVSNSNWTCILGVKTVHW